jgi:NAD(P)-dependent dehydrogenase (short-subunit alcohol dehydrogenase family)
MGGGLAAPVLCLEDPNPKAGLAAASDAFLSASSQAADFRQTLGLAVRPLANYTLAVSSGAAAGNAGACALAVRFVPLAGTTSFACTEFTPGGAQFAAREAATPPSASSPWVPPPPVGWRPGGGAAQRWACLGSAGGPLAATEAAPGAREELARVLADLAAGGSISPVALRDGLALRSCDVSAAEAASLAGKTALVTGAASGLGLETVKALTSAGCRVLATARDVAAGERVIAAELAGGAGAATPYAGRADLVKVLPLDLASLASVRALAGALAAEAPLDYVILNAGIMALEQREETAAGFEKQLGVNHFAQHLLVSLLRPRLVARAAPARVIYLSSLAHKSGSVDVANLHFAPPRRYVPWVAYGQSKKCNILDARELADQLAVEAPHVTAVSVHPGVIKTNLARHMSMLKNPFVMWIFTTFVADKSIEQGAATTIYAALAPAIPRGAYLVDCAPAAADAEGTDAGGALRKALWAATERCLVKERRA